MRQAIFAAFLVITVLSAASPPPAAGTQAGSSASCSTCISGREDRVRKVLAKKQAPDRKASLAVKNQTSAATATRVDSKKKRKKTSPPKGIEVAEKIASQPVEVYPEKTVWIKLSNTDVNRVVCPAGPITYIFSSKEKGVITEIKEDEAYLKFNVKLNPNTGKPSYVWRPTEFHIRCAGQTYSFIGQPVMIRSRTIYLVSQRAKAAPDEQILKKDSLDSAIVAVVRAVFTGKVPPSWDTANPPEGQPGALQPVSITKTFEDTTVRIKEKARWRIPGVPVIVRLFTLEPDSRVQVNEKLLLDPSITKNPVAISILDHVVASGRSTAAVIIERYQGGQ